MMTVVWVVLGDEGGEVEEEEEEEGGGGAQVTEVEEEGLMPDDRPWMPLTRMEML